MKLWVKILIALAAGLIVGRILGPSAQHLKPIGSVFLNLINMVIVPLIVSTMTVGITNIHDPKKLGRLGIKTLALYLITTMLAIALGLAIAHVVQPGKIAHVPPRQMADVPTPDWEEMLLGIVPSNPVAAMAEGQVLQLIVFALFLGISINFAGQKAKPLLRALESLAEVMYRMTSLIMELSPIGVFAIMAWVAGTFGTDVLTSLLKFLVGYYVGGMIHVGLVFCGILYFFARVKPLPFFRGMSDAAMVGFSTASSSAALPVTMHCVQHNLGVSRNVCGFVLPLGSTVNMNGAAMFQGMAALFVAQMYGIELSLMQMVTITVTSALSAIGAAGVAGSGIVMTSMVFQSVGLPVEGIGILYGIDRVREMMSAMLNVLGDAVCAVYVAKKEGELDEHQYYHSELVELEGSEF